MEEHGEHRPLVGPAIALALWAIGIAAPAGAACRQALVLALDVSGSVDMREYRLQLDGVAAALQDAQVRRALAALPETPVYLAVFEWSGSRFQRLLVDWTALAGDAQVDAVAGRLRATDRVVAPQATAIGAALMRAGDLLADAPACWKRTVDVSGDGKNNDWPDPQDVHAGSALAGVTVNGLVVGAESAGTGDMAHRTAAELSAYFQAEVIRGPDAFVETAVGYRDYQRAMTRKLLRELQTVAVGAADLGRAVES